MPRSIDALVEQQVTKWRLENARPDAAGATALRWPVITISREYFALGESLAREVARRTGFTTWDRELVQHIAESSGAAHGGLLGSLDEHTRTAMEDWIDGSLIGPSYVASEYLRQLMRVVHTISGHGSAVIVGRGAQYILKPEVALRVRAVSERDVRIRRLAERQGLTAGAAATELSRVDRERDAYLRHHFKGVRPEDPVSYDVVLNTGTLALPEAAEVVLSAYAAKFGRAAPRAP